MAQNPKQSAFAALMANVAVKKGAVHAAMPASQNQDCPCSHDPKSTCSGIWDKQKMEFKCVKCRDCIPF